MLSEEDIKARFIPFDSLRYTTEAFIDYCIPECSPKYNYALIGPGVSQNPKQPVSLREKHGFQVGGISMPHGKTNPAHMHFTAEVFICFKGDWQMQWGFNPGVQTADVGEGDVLTVPPWIYRGFKNIGVDDGFMFTGLGRDSTGGILWGPSTLAAASAQGVHLTEDYQIIDERAGQKWNGSQKALAPKFTNRPLRQAAERLQQLSAEYDRRQADLVAQARAWAVCQRLPEPVISHTMDVDLSWGSPAPPARLGLPWCVSSTCGTPSCAPLTRAGGGRGCHLLRGVGLGVCRAG
jgi:mannose-6-phosphate isomerase-like protein (cupin superfamily)